ncbi:multiple sugar transport system permease protein [Caldalkalibacillus uzonensis]|uniref:Multiple sugar transport system permease protein n=1 Tax=Caldalkalibacillus uzonensis TaxID=353224 RepID=A0ABU0CPJ4_9BACI|nr:carbohydrate ABC transporter permease [Caldalkalibacillus uzonensis]MDQ0338309.1 multiple sugar transport system permease protein [Caldalkalibacillus uzonensis]
MVHPSRIQKGLTLLAAYFLVVVLLFPYVVMLVTALKSRSEVYSIPPTFFPREWTVSNFLEIWTVIPLSTYIWNTILIATGSTLLTLFCAIPAAYVLSRRQFVGKRAYMYLVLITQMFSPIVLLVGLFRVIQWLGLMDSIWGLVLVNAAFTQAFAIWLLTGYFSTIPRELEQAAWIDGCSKLKTLVKIVLPLATPGIITTVIFVFIMAWNEFVVALTIISSDVSRPLTVGIYAFFGKYDVQWQYLFATSLVATIPVIILFLAIEKYLVSGLTAGGVKD